LKRQEEVAAWEAAINKQLETDKAEQASQAAAQQAKEIER
jgi:hypothetical protein